MSLRPIDSPATAAETGDHWHRGQGLWPNHHWSHWEGEVKLDTEQGVLGSGVAHLMYCIQQLDSHSEHSAWAMIHLHSHLYKCLACTEQNLWVIATAIKLMAPGPSMDHCPLEQYEEQIRLLYRSWLMSSAAFSVLTGSPWILLASNLHSLKWYSTPACQSGNCSILLHHLCTKIELNYHRPKFACLRVTS